MIESTITRRIMITSFQPPGTTGALTTSDGMPEQDFLGVPESRSFTVDDTSEILARAAAKRAHTTVDGQRQHAVDRHPLAMNVHEAKAHMLEVARIANVAVTPEDIDVALREYKPTLAERLRQIETLGATPDKAVVADFVVRAIAASLEIYLSQRGLDQIQAKLTKVEDVGSQTKFQEGGHGLGWQVHRNHHEFRLTEKRSPSLWDRFWSSARRKEETPPAIAVESAFIENDIVIKLFDLNCAPVIQDLQPFFEVLRQYYPISIAVGGSICVISASRRPPIEGIGL
jgi:hypothetical protein